MPATVKVLLKRKLEDLNGKWDKDFLASVSKTVILQPLFIKVHEDCKINTNYYLRKLALDSTDEMSHSYKENMNKAIIYSLSNYSVQVTESFLQIFEFDNNNILQIFSKKIILAPCLLEQKLKFKGRRID